CRSSKRSWQNSCATGTRPRPSAPAYHDLTNTWQGRLGHGDQDSGVPGTLARVFGGGGAVAARPPGRRPAGGRGGAGGRRGAWAWYNFGPDLRRYLKMRQM